MDEQKICFLIDDDADDQEVFAMTLSEIDSSIQCFSAHNGLEALEKLRNPTAFIPNYIFLDLNMPLMDGRQCLIEIKKMPHLHHIPLVIYSTSSDEKVQFELMNLGASEYMVKPAQVSALIQTLSEFFLKY
jgi:CheY-like chemotaxis protein